MRIRSVFSGDGYVAFLCAVLLGYALLGKGFAYLGLPPLYVGEIALACGLVALCRSGILISPFMSLPSSLLAITMTWVTIRTLPYLGVFGVDAIRDSMVLMYGLFAFVVISLILADARRLNLTLSYFDRFVTIYISLAPFIFAIQKYAGDYLPKWSSGVPVLAIKDGEMAVHLAGIAVFCLAGFRKLTRVQLALFTVAVVQVAAAGRGGLLAFLVPVTCAAIVLGKFRQMCLIAASGLVLFASAYVVETSLDPNFKEARISSERPVSTRQIAENVASIFGSSGEQTEGTKTWRIEWWKIITSNTLDGPYFWSGRGFGLNLAAADGFAGPRDDFRLRSPHNVSFTILARAGVPGLCLWWLLLLAWFSSMANGVRVARVTKDFAWSGFFLFVMSYLAAGLINGTFDVALEGPMQGIWFWCIFGLGIGAKMVYAAGANVRSSSPRRATALGKTVVAEQRT